MAQPTHHIAAVPGGDEPHCAVAEWGRGVVSLGKCVIAEEANRQRYVVTLGYRDGRPLFATLHCLLESVRGQQGAPVGSGERVNHGHAAMRPGCGGPSGRGNNRTALRGF